MWTSLRNSVSSLTPTKHPTNIVLWIFFWISCSLCKSTPEGQRLLSVDHSVTRYYYLITHTGVVNGRLEYVAHCWLAYNSLMVRPPTSSDSSVPLEWLCQTIVKWIWASLVVSSPDTTPPQRRHNDYYKISCMRWAQQSWFRVSQRDRWFTFVTWLVALQSVYMCSLTLCRLYTWPAY